MAPAKKAPAKTAAKSAKQSGKKSTTKTAPAKAAKKSSGGAKKAPAAKPPTKKAAAAPKKAAAAKAAKTPAKQPAKAVKQQAKAVAAKATTKATPAKTAKSAPQPAPAKALAKAAAPAKTVPPVPRQPTKPAPRKLTAADKAFFKEQETLLREERASYETQAEALKAQADLLAQEMEPGDVQFDEESGEGGSANVDRERDLALSAAARAAVEEIDRALAKIKTGMYGLCERCGQPIPRLRLKAIPHADLCVGCKSGGLSRRA